MTKRQELEVLNKAIQELGDASYLGPWLSRVCLEVQSLIASDLEPDIRLGDAIRAVEDAQLHAQQIVAAAKQEAAQMLHEATLEAHKSKEDGLRVRRQILENTVAKLKEVL